MSNWVTQFQTLANVTAGASGGTSNIPDLSLPMTDGSGMSELQTFNQIASGADDSVWTGIVNDYKAAGFTTIYIRPGWEMNGNWYPWSVQTEAMAQAYIAAFDRISEVAHSVAGINVEMIWDPATSDSSAIPTQDMYPGDSYVDIVGVDFYDNLYPYTLYDWSTGKVDATIQQWEANPVNLAHYWNYPDATARAPLGGGNQWGLVAAMQFALAHNKPFALPETGDNGNGTTTGPLSNPYFPQYLADALTAAGAPALAFVSIWDKYGSSSQFTLGANPTMAAAWAAFVAEIEAAAGAPPQVTAGATITVAHGQVTNLLSALSALITPGETGDTEIISAVTAQTGTVAIGSDGSIMYTAGAAGTDQISYTVTDQRGDSVNATTAIAIDAGPSIDAGTLKLAAGSSESMAALAASLVTPGLPGDTESFSKVSAVSGTVTTGANGTIVYTAPASGTDTLRYTVTDQLGDSVTGTSKIAADPGPSTTAGTGTAKPYQTLNLTKAISHLITPGLAGDVETITAISAARGTVSLKAGIITYSAPYGGIDTLTYTVQDQLGDTATGTYTIGVGPGTINGGVLRFGGPGDTIYGNFDSGVIVSLLNASGTVLTTQTTASNGWYSFGNLAAGSYSLTFTAPTGQVLRAGSAAQTAPIAVTAGTTVTQPTVNFVVMASLAGQVQFGGSGQSGVQVQLLGAAGQVLQTATTDGNGNFAFYGLAAGNYQVQYAIPAGETPQPGGAVSAGGLSGVVSLAAAQAATLPAAVLVGGSLAAIAGSVLYGGAGESGVTVNLYDLNGNLLANTVSGSDGSFTFSGLAAGSYTVGYVAPPWQHLLLGGPANVVTGMTAAITATAGTTTQLAPEQLLTYPANVQGIVLHFGGLTDPGWGGPDSGVTVSLLDTTGNVIATTVTDQNGWFVFRPLGAGTYQVSVTPPAGQAAKPNTSLVSPPLVVAAGTTVYAPVFDTVSAAVLNGSGLTASLTNGSYVVTGSASNSTVTLGDGNQQVTLTGTADTVVTSNGNQSISLAGAGNSVTVGTGSSQISTGTGGGAVVHAAGGVVSITAGGAGNLLDTGAGMGFITADGSAGNVFVLNPGGAAQMVKIGGFNVAAGDVLDVGRTLAGTAILPDLSNIASFVTSAVNGGNTTLFALPAAGGAPQPFVTLMGVQTSVGALLAAHDFSLA